MIIVIYLLAGIFAGLVAGLLGVGGGIVVVPVLIFAFEAQGFSDQVLTHMAIGTSLATIVFTSASSIFNHNRLGSVLWPVFRPMSMGIVLGAICGVFTVVQLDGALLKKLIGFFAMFVSIKMLLSKSGKGSLLLPGNPVLVMVGAVIGWVSSIFGIGGGTLTVPFLSRYKIKMKKVVGTSAACGMPIALAGAITNVFVGSGVEGRPEGSVGYLYLPALFGVAIASVYFAKVGAKLAHRLKARILRRCFAVTLFVVGIRFLVF